MLLTDIIKKRVLVIGANGMLGQRQMRYFAEQDSVELLGAGAEPEPALAFGVPYQQCDVTSRDEVKKLVYGFYPDLIINASAYTNVDGAESNRETAWKVNVKGVEYIAEYGRVHDAHIIHFSTDYVFDGSKGPYNELDKPNPLGYYARTKLASENALQASGANFSIIRTNVLYGIIPSGRLDYVRWVIQELRAGREIRIVTDQINNPTFIDDLVAATVAIAGYKKYGLYNIGGREFLNRYAFTMRIADFFGLESTLVTPILTADLKQAAKRPLSSGLITLKAETEFGFKPTTIETSFQLMKEALHL